MRGGLHLGGTGTDWLLSILDDNAAPESSPNRDIALAALNGICDDHLAATPNPLAIAMQLFSDGRCLPLERATIEAAIPRARGRLAVLAHGLCMSDRARDRDCFELSGDCRRPVPLPPGVACFAIAATKAAAANNFHDSLVGDGLAPVASALGEHADPSRRLAFDPDRQWIGTKMNHFDLLRRRDVLEWIARWL